MCHIIAEGGSLIYTGRDMCSAWAWMYKLFYKTMTVCFVKEQYRNWPILPDLYTISLSLKQTGVTDKEWNKHES